MAKLLSLFLGAESHEILLQHKSSSPAAAFFGFRFHVTEKPDA